MIPNSRASAYAEVFSSYIPHLQYAVTLTFKAKALIPLGYKPRPTPSKDCVWAICKRYYPQYQWNEGFTYKEWRYLNESIAQSTLRYFYTRLTHLIFGKDSKRASTKGYSKPLMITSIEGLGARSHKRIHAHLAIGNLPPHIDVRNMVEIAWHQCDFAYRQLSVKPITHGEGWLEYLCKEMESDNCDALQLQSIYEPLSYRTAWA